MPSRMQFVAILHWISSSAKHTQFLCSESSSSSCIIMHHHHHHRIHYLHASLHYAVNSHSLSSLQQSLTQKEYSSIIIIVARHRIVPFFASFKTPIRSSSLRHHPPSVVITTSDHGFVS
jgi:hypothetical protein